MVGVVQTVSQSEPPIFVQGRELESLPQDLYIPPDALRVFLEMFKGPLDLLLYLIRKHDLDILDISIAEITDQYLSYIEMMSVMRLQLAGDYLVMAATLAELKSRLLLPQPTPSEEDEEDPRADLLQRLLEYEQIKLAAETLDGLPRLERDIVSTQVHVEVNEIEVPPPNVMIADLVFAFAEVMQRSQLFQSHDITIEPLTVQEQMTRMIQILEEAKEFVEFARLFDVELGRRGLVYTFLALLELLRTQAIEVVQRHPSAKIYVKLGEAA